MHRTSIPTPIESTSCMFYMSNTICGGQHSTGAVLPCKSGELLCPSLSPALNDHRPGLRGSPSFQHQAFDSRLLFSIDRRRGHLNTEEISLPSFEGRYSLY